MFKDIKKTCKNNYNISVFVMAETRKKLSLAWLSLTTDSRAE